MISMARKNDLEAARFWLQPLAVLQGLVVALGFLFLFSTGLAVVVYFSYWQATPSLLTLLAHLAVFAGAFWSGKKCLRKAWIHGIAVGCLAFLLFGFLGSGGHAFSSWLWWQRLLRMVLVTMLGGMVGGLLKDG